MSTRARIVAVGVVLLLLIDVAVLWDRVGIWTLVVAVVVAALLGLGFTLGRSTRPGSR
jgi:hypothetical protein